MSPITAKLTTHCIPSTYKSHARLLFAPIQRLVLHDLVTRRFFVSVSIAGHSWTVQTLQRWSTPYTNPGPGHELGDAPFGQACRCSASAWRTRCLCVCVSTQSRGGKMQLDFAFVTQSLDQGSRLIEDASYLRVTARPDPRVCSLNKPTSPL